MLSIRHLGENLLNSAQSIKPFQDSFEEFEDQNIKFEYLYLCIIQQQPCKLILKYRILVFQIVRQRMTATESSCISKDIVIRKS